MIAVPSIRPTTISALRPRRRPTLRTPRRRKMRFRSASAPTAASTTARTRTSAVARPPTGMPKSLLTTTSSHAGQRRRVGDRDVVCLAPRERAHQRHELLDLGCVEATGQAALGCFLVCPERDRERLALRRREHVAAFVAGLFLQLRNDRLLKAFDRAGD